MLAIASAINSSITGEPVNTELLNYPPTVNDILDRCTKYQSLNHQDRSDLEFELEDYFLWAPEHIGDIFFSST